MNFKIKGIGWVGGICQKFETLCHEVDNIVNQDTLKYVENQAQTVGRSVKRLYSDVVHDMMPPLNHEGLGAALASAKIDTYAKSEAAIEENHIDSVAVDPFAEQFDHASNELQLSDQSSTPTAVDALEGAESSIMLGQRSDVSKKTISDVIIENSIVGKISASEVLELISSCKENSTGPSLKNEFTSCDDKSSCAVMGEVLLNMSVHDMEFQSTENEGTIDKNIEVDAVEKQLECAFSELCLVDQLDRPNSVTSDSLLETENVNSGQATDVLKDLNSEVNIKEDAKIEKPSFEVSDLISHAEKEGFGASSLTKFTDFDDKESCRAEAEVLPATSVRGVREPFAPDVSELISPGEEEPFAASSMLEFFKYNDKNSCGVCADVSPATFGSQNAKTVKNDFEDNSEYDPDASGHIMSSNVVCCEENMAELDSALKDFYFSKNSAENSPAKALLHHDPVDVTGLASHNMHSSSLLTPLLSNDNKLTGEGSISFSNDVSIESHENNAFKTVDATESRNGILGNKNVHSDGESSQLKAFCSSDIEPKDESTDDISIATMETIELCDKVKLEDSCVIIDGTALYAVSRIMRKHRSYKKMIQDALTSKKRLAKEYEQLAIWFGDADMGSNQWPCPSTSTTSDLKNPQTELCEWELL